MHRLVALLSAWTLAASAASAGAQTPSAAQVAAQSAESVINNCIVQSVGAFPNRVHILCSILPQLGIGGSSGQAGGAVRYFAVENSVAANAMALTVLSVAHTAVQRNRSLTIVYRNNPNENPPGCNPRDCRRIVGVMMN